MDNIVYINAKGEVKPYQLHDISESGDYFQAFHNGTLKTFRKDRVIWQGDDPDQCRQVAAESQSISLPKAERTPEKKLLEVCFTGFAKNKKAELIALAESSQCLVRQGVTNNLDILCYGSNAGPVKMKSARDSGILILTDLEFIHLLETGEIPLEQE